MAYIYTKKKSIFVGFFFSAVQAHKRIAYLERHEMENFILN